jgi:hypothetical protein
MAENTVEAVIRMRDLASQAMLQMNKSLELLDEASKGADRGLQRVEKAASTTRGTISVLTRTTRFAAIGLISELDPAIGQVVARMTSLGAVASATGSLIKGGLIVGGITLVVGALSNWVQATNRQIDFQLKLNQTFADFNVQGAATQIRELNIAMDEFRAKTTTGLGPVIQFWKDLFNRVTTGRTQQEELNDQLARTQQRFEQMRVREFAQQMAELTLRTEQAREATDRRNLSEAVSVERVAQVGQAMQKRLDRERELSLGIVEEERKTARQRAVAAGQLGPELDRIEREAASKRLLVLVQFGERAIQLERTIRDARAKAQEGLVDLIVEGQEAAAAGQLSALVALGEKSEALRQIEVQGQQQLSEDIVDAWEAAQKGALDAMESMAAQAGDSTARTKDLFTDAGQSIKGTLADALEGFATGKFRGFESLWQSLWQNLVSITSDAAAQMLLFGSEGFGGAGNVPGGGIFGLLQGLPALFGFQKGGLVSKPTAALLHPGERVIPAGEAGGGMGGVTVINLSDPEKLAGIVAQETSKGREIVVNDVIQGMRSNRGIRRGVQRFGR